MHLEKPKLILKVCNLWLETTPEAVAGENRGHTHIQSAKRVPAGTPKPVERRFPEGGNTELSLRTIGTPRDELNGMSIQGLNL